MMQNEVNEDVLSDVLAAVLVAFPVRFGIDRDSLGFDDTLESISKGDIHLASHTLMDLHEMLELELNYMPFTEFEKFKNIKDVVEYFYIMLLDQKEA